MFTLKDVIYAGAILVVWAYTIYKEMKEVRARAHGMAPNPERCEKHAVALAALDERLKGVEEDVHDIKESLKHKK